MIDRPLDECSNTERYESAAQDLKCQVDCRHIRAASVFRLAIATFVCGVAFGCGQSDEPQAPSPNKHSEPIGTKMLSPDTSEEISALVRSGFYDKELLMTILCEEMYAPGELEPGDVSAALDSEFAKWEAEKLTWPEVTDCDRLDAAFVAISKRGIIALQNAGYTQSDGYDDFCEAYDQHPDKSTVLGYCFYHGQDLDRAVRGAGLYLAFGPVNPNDEATKGAEIGNIVREELERVGLKVEWDGSFDERLMIRDLVWQRR
jgi:hypothetical protein